jgi:hypothetical protein
MGSRLRRDALLCASWMLKPCLIGVIRALNFLGARFEVRTSRQCFSTSRNVARIEFSEFGRKAATMGSSSVKSGIGTIRRVSCTVSAMCRGAIETPIPAATSINKECFSLTCKVSFVGCGRHAGFPNRDRWNQSRNDRQVASVGLTAPASANFRV